MTRLAPALLVAVAMIAFEGIDAAPSDNDVAPGPTGEIRVTGSIHFTGAILESAGNQAVADARSIASVPPGHAVRRGSPDAGKHDPPRTVVVLPPRKEGERVVVITYD
jgi:hypothetical protein